MNICVFLVPKNTQPILTLPDGTEVYEIPGGVPPGTTIVLEEPEDRVYQPAEVSCLISICCV